MHDIAEFLGGRDPFRGLDEGALEELARRTEVEFFAAGTLLDSPDDPREVIRVVRRGAIELLEDGRVVDLLVEGELIGPPSRLSGELTARTARAAEDSLTYSLPAADVLPLLTTRTWRDLTGSELSAQPVRALVRRAPVSCPPESTLREVARRMGEEGVGSMLVASEGVGDWGIVTDRDLRTRAIADGIPLDTPVREVMSAPLISVSVDRSVAETMLIMLDNDIRHVGVTEDGSRVIGVISDGDLLVAESRTPFVLRRAIREADSKERLGDVARGMRDGVVALHGTGLSSVRISEMITAVSDALIRRMIELAVETLGDPPAEFAWLAMGSHGRREAVLSSDVDSGMAWRTPSQHAETAEPGDAIASYMKAVADDVAGCMREAGWHLDPHGVTATSAFAASSAEAWREATSDWLSRPADEGVMVAASITLDSRVVLGSAELDPKRFLFEGENRTRLARLMLRSALASRPPTGFLRDVVVEHTGEHRGTFDIKRGGLIPVVDLARYGALEAGVAATSTPQRLRAAGDAGVIEAARARSLERAFELFAGLRLDHQVRQLDRGERVDDHLDPGDLDPLTRRYLRDAFREVAAVQRSLSSELELTRGRI